MQTRLRDRTQLRSRRPLRTQRRLRDQGTGTPLAAWSVSRVWFACEPKSVAEPKTLAEPTTVCIRMHIYIYILFIISFCLSHEATRSVQYIYIYICTPCLFDQGVSFCLLIRSSLATPYTNEIHTYRDRTTAS